ncbi:terpene synthase family protein [Actinomadura sp. NEAU-AAG7]|uniref:terpene synthase family protein n=1 Tax=Actinomadura sp. NEAU-AAG7 TaxID=2839640 RepID=UPI0027DFB96E|nr:terpene synthase family protein [Actinomadura sp. NEAU-AAG7]
MRHLGWAQKTGLIQGEEASRRYLDSELADLAAYIFIDATGADMDLMYDLTGWFFFFDDVFEVHPGQSPQSALTAYQQMHTILSSPPGPAPAGACTEVAAFADIWQRETAGMSPRWVRRAAHNWADWIRSCLTEMADRLTGTTLSLNDYLALRRHTVGMVPTLDAAQRGVHYQVPDIAYHHSHLQHLLGLAADQISLVNDLYSLEKEEAVGNTNAVHCLMRTRRITRDAAIQATAELANARARAFIRYAEHLPALARSLGITPAETDAVNRCVEHARLLMRAHSHWGFTLCSRYQQPPAAQP